MNDRQEPNTPRDLAAVQAVNLVWFRDDLRTEDHPALSAAMGQGPTVGIYILDEQTSGIRPLGGAAKWWLHHALLDLHASLEALGVPLLVFRGEPSRVFERLASQLAVNQVHWNRRYALAERELDTRIKSWLGEQGIEATSHAAWLLAEPWHILNNQGGAYQIFAAFYRRIQEAQLRVPLPAPGAQAPFTPPSGLEDCPVAELDLLPTHPDWGGKLAAAWQPGERSAQERLDYVISEVAADYEDGHDRPDVDGTSKLSPFLRWGHLSAQQLFSALQPLLEDAGAHAGAAAMLRQLAWRDFCWHLLYHYPHLSTENFRREYDAMGWAWPNEQEQTVAEWRAWTRGETGYRLVDAGMQQLWQTGWMHNRVRMVVASFLVKNLQIHWRAGEEWFWDTLVDADPASNAVNWQWVAGSGTDASPFFRVFNPELQAKKFDPQGSYAAQFAPLAHEPLVDLKETRARALQAYADMRQARE